MLIDVGTNGETVIGNRDFLVCCACSAGPAFEGGGISSRHARGRRRDPAGRGDRGRGLAYETIGATPPRGHLRIGPRRPAGRAAPGRVHGPRGPAPGRRAARARGPGRARGAGGAGRRRRRPAGTSRSRTADIENLLRAKAAVYAGAALLARRLGIDDVRSSSGSTSPAASAPTSTSSKAILIGLLPDVPLERMTFIGNGSVAGAKMGLLATRRSGGGRSRSPGR